MNEWSSIRFEICLEKQIESLVIPGLFEKETMDINELIVDKILSFVLKYFQVWTGKLENVAF